MPDIDRISEKKVPTVLMILDGWGISSGSGKDAIESASTPHWDSLIEKYPSTTLGAAGLDVGLPDGQIGNSEVGHLNLGAGRVVYQGLTRINSSIKTGEFFHNPALLEAVEKVREGSGRIHVMGLMSDGGVHSHIDQIKAFTTLADDNGVKEILVHAFMDGRDTPPNSGVDHIARMADHLATLTYARISTVTGRYYAMDRDNRWDRVEKAYRAMVQGDGLMADSGVDAVREAYDRGESDEFILPTIVDPGNKSPGSIDDGDGIVFMNFRGDRAREITHALNDMDFSHFTREKTPTLSCYVCLAEYDEIFPYPVAFPTLELKGIMGEIIGDGGMTQLRIAETEKYAHVTFFFNGGEEKTFPGEDRALIPSPRDVPTYDLKPQMSAIEVTDELIRRLDSGGYDFILVNYANPDMVGHTGIFDAAVAAIETVDSCIGKITGKVLEMGGSMIITSDHGNAESMQDNDGTAHTAHTTRRVPMILVGEEYSPESLRLKEGILADVAPTLFKIMDIAQPPEMTGKPLF